MFDGRINNKIPISDLGILRELVEMIGGDHAQDGMNDQQLRGGYASPRPIVLIDAKSACESWSPGKRKSMLRFVVYIARPIG